jgi:hypothetical protein
VVYFDYPLMIFYIYYLIYLIKTFLIILKMIINNFKDVIIEASILLDILNYLLFVSFLFIFLSSLFILTIL